MKIIQLVLLYCDMIKVNNNDFNGYKENELQQHHEEERHR
jgi:hypothetical protein